MDDMNALERQVAGEVLRSVGPVRPVDDLAIYNATAAVSSSPRWGFTMFSALKFIAAGVIVALFGGFLLAGVLTTPQNDEVLPAAGTGSPSPMTSEELLSGMVTEEVEPGVFRVLNDGVRDLSFEGWSYGLIAGHDGSIWVEGAKDIVRLGSTANESHKWPEGSPRGKFMVARDGTVWMHDGHHAAGVDARLRSNDGGSWTVRLRVPALGAWTIAPDGTVWAAYGKDWEDGLLVARLGADGWEPFVGSEPGWVDDIVVTQSGEVWVDVAEGSRDSLWRYREDDREDAGEWQEVTVDAVSSDIWTQFIEVGTDGTVWFAGIALLMADGELVLDENGRPEEGDSFLMRFDGNEWQRWGPADGLPPLGYVSGVTLIPTPDGGLWLAMRPLDVGIGSRMLEAPPCSEHPGVARFDRTDWHHFLAGHCVMDLVVAPDGSVWLRAASDDRDGPQQIYVITPEAVAVTE